MTAALTEMTHCPDPETLAAFVDRRLEAAERTKVLEHMATCAECRDTVVLATELLAEEAPPVARPVFGGPMKKQWAALIAAAAVAAGVWVAMPAVMAWRDPMRNAAKYASSLEQRSGDQRLSVDASYKEPTSTPRGGGDEPPSTHKKNWSTALLEAQERADENPTAGNLHALGVINLLDENRRDAVATLKKAVASTDHPSAALWNDLAAAYFPVGEYEHALEASERAWRIEQSPTAAWNRALALERLGHDDKAVEAWQQYRALEKDERWRAEAQKRIDQLEELRALKRPR